MEETVGEYICDFRVRKEYWEENSNRCESVGEKNLVMPETQWTIKGQATKVFVFRLYKEFIQKQK